MSQSHREMRSQIDSRLDELLPEIDCDPVVRSMRYSLLAVGKRLRPMMTLMTAAAFGDRESRALDPACSIEMIHAASLILDDLPSMDDAALRRGRASNHLAFGEDVAILASFALLNHAFAVVARAETLVPELRNRIVGSLSAAVGNDGVIGGQLADLRGNRASGAVDDVHATHRRKTGSLFVAAVETGALVAGVAEEGLGPIRNYANNFGMSFQALDDLADRRSTTQSEGKDVGKDCEKATIVSAVGSEQALLDAERFASAAERALEPIGPASTPLANLAQSLVASARRLATPS